MSPKFQTNAKERIVDPIAIGFKEVKLPLRVLMTEDEKKDFYIADSLNTVGAVVNICLAERPGYRKRRSHATDILQRLGMKQAEAKGLVAAITRGSQREVVFQVRPLPKRKIISQIKVRGVGFRNTR
ncbi:MAG: hypothetical protein UT63_C0002G0014 [Candidatus Gottesmanbacteria bacterium GW2011_GWC2_39_8]|uniref:Uncharacterized protein n=1 Tax=Candidatus Gottesmanbacteria bacterium GW2011_GWC2_39_8 TaxID=1618450 RepID=A0A0G0Q1W0_9BACT|nr:MAG: hypothetical protein UT63_C0002G0014 [Candidatus Gottesmanbacteria bacterium GW2011_GWC2_39_8]